MTGFNEDELSKSFRIDLLDHECLWILLRTILSLSTNGIIVKKAEHRCDQLNADNLYAVKWHGKNESRRNTC